MKQYSIYSGRGALAIISINIEDEEKFSKEMHDYQCGNDYTDRRHLTVEDFGKHMNEKGYSCQVTLLEKEHHWWLQD